MNSSSLATKFNRDFEVYIKGRDFSPHVLMENIFKHYDMSRSKFIRLTHLDPSFYSLATKKGHRLSKKSIVTICFAFGIDWPMTEFTLERHGRKLFDERRLDFAYKYVITHRTDIKIDYENFLKSERRKEMMKSKYFNEDECAKELEAIECTGGMMIDACNYFLKSSGFKESDFLGTQSYNIGNNK